MITIRKATPADVVTVVSYIEKKAAFDRGLGYDFGILGTTTERISKALFGAPAFAHALLAIADERPLGFAFYHYRFSSFKARPNLWLDDLYVDAEVRRSGAGIALMSVLASEAAMHDCTHIAWTANAKNPSGVPFYTKLNATLVSQNGSRLEYSITPEVLGRRIAEIEQPDQALEPTPSSPAVKGSFRGAETPVGTIAK
jgi:GNAT superfamily N-acetyltransferase